MRKIFVRILFCMFSVFTIAISQELVNAVVSRDIDRLKFILSQRIDVNMRASDGMLPLAIAAQNGDSLIADLLLKHGAKIDETVRLKTGEKEETEKTALMLAAENGHFGVIALLSQEHADLDKQAKCILTMDNHTYIGDGRTALMMAVRSRHTEIVRLLVDRKAKINTQEEAIITLLEPNLKGGYDKPFFTSTPVYVKHSTALHIAVELGDTSTVRLLLQGGADVNIENGWKQTPLVIAVAKGYTSIASMLVANGADVNVQKNTLSSPLVIATKNGDKEVADVLLANGADVHQKAGPIGAPLLSWAILSANTDLVKDLLSHGADINATTDNNSTPLHIAAGNGNDEVLSLLITKNANINSVNDNGQTPLILAAKKGQAQTVMTLLIAGADYTLQDHAQKTALSYAREGHYQSIIDMLTKSGAKE